MDNCGIFIPARMRSTRFFGKPLEEIPAVGGGIPMVVKVAAAAKATGMPYFVVTPDAIITKTCQKYQLDCLQLNHEAENGTERAAMAHDYLGEPWDKIIVLQCDEVDVSADLINGLAKREPLCTVVCEGATMSPNDVKACVDYANGLVKRFVRWTPTPEFRHVGIYLYSRNSLHDYLAWPGEGEEIAQSLEQLRFFANGYNHNKKWRYLHEPVAMRSVNVPADLEKFKRTEE